MNIIKKIFVWAMMLTATIAAVSCSSDDGGEGTFTANDMEQMYGRYVNLVTYGQNAGNTVVNVWVSDGQVSFNIPIIDILPSVLSAEGGLEEALATVQCDNVKESYKLVRYHSSTATFSLNAQTVKFSYTVSGKKNNGTVKITTPSFSYNTSTHKLILGYTVDAVTLNGTAIESYKKREVYLLPAEKQPESSN